MRTNLCNGPILSVLTAAASVLLPSLVAAFGEFAGTPTQGERGVAVTVASIMARAAVADSLANEEIEAIQQPDRRGLPLDPASLSVPASPGNPPRAGSPSPGSARRARAIGARWTGAGDGSPGSPIAWERDCTEAAGPSQHLASANGRLMTIDSSAGAPDGVIDTTPDRFFEAVRNGAGVSGLRVRYDRLTGRWFLAAITTSTPNRILIAASDAAGGGAIGPESVFTFFSIPVESTPPTIPATCVADHPTLAVDANALYVGVNDFCGRNRTFDSTDGYVIRKSSVLGPGPIVVTVFRGLAPTFSSAGPFAPRGVDSEDPASSEGYFIGVDNAALGRLQMRRIADHGGTPSISRSIAITVPATAPPSRSLRAGNRKNAKGNGTGLAVSDDRLAGARIRNGRLWTAHSIRADASGTASKSGAHTGSRWYELDVSRRAGAPAVVRSGTIVDSEAQPPCLDALLLRHISAQEPAADSERTTAAGIRPVEAVPDPPPGGVEPAPEALAEDPGPPSEGPPPKPSPEFRMPVPTFSPSPRAARAEPAPAVSFATLPAPAAPLAEPEFEMPVPSFPPALRGAGAEAPRTISLRPLPTPAAPLPAPVAEPTPEPPPAETSPAPAAPLPAPVAAETSPAPPAGTSPAPPAEVSPAPAAPAPEPPPAETSPAPPAEDEGAETIGLAAVRTREPITDFRLIAIDAYPGQRTVRIEFTVARESPVRVSVADLRGREVVLLVDQVLPRGRYRATWGLLSGAGRVAAGAYLVHYRTAESLLTRRIASGP